MNNREGMPNLTRDEVLARLADAVGGDVSPYAALLQRSIWLRVDPSRKPDLMESRFGGPAMMPDGFEWPMYTAEPYMGRDPNEDPQTFTIWYAKQQKLPMWLIAQLNLAELPMETPLPREGLLSFFTDPFDGIWGNEKSDQQGIRLAYVSPEQFSVLRPCHRPEATDHHGEFADWVWPQYRMQYYIKWAFSDWDEVRRLNEQAADARPYDDVQERLSDTMTEVFGYSFGHFLLDGGRNHQGDPRGSAERVWNPDPEPPEDMEYDVYLQQREQFDRRAAATWTCLLSITNDDLLRPVVSDTGGLSFLIRNSDLAERRFDRPWIVRS
jgi:uncharacterized protein YwqG